MMKHRNLLVPLLLTSGLALLAQRYPEFTRWMKASEEAATALKNIETKTGPEAVRSAETLGAVYENMIGFWRQRNARKAVEWSQEGKAAAVELADAVHAGDAAKAGAAFRALDATCISCHQAYRVELSGGRFAFKP